MIGETHHINRRVAQSGFRAFDYARACGHRLTTYAVINLSDTATLGAVTAFRKVRHKFRDWLTHHGKKRGQPLPPIYVYTFENPNGSMHVNWAVHIPDGLEAEFEKKLTGWVQKITGRIGPFDVKVQPINDDYAKKLAKYLFKGTDPHYVTHFHLQNDHAPQGRVTGKRAGISQAIGLKARERSGYHPGRNRPYIPRPSHSQAAAAGPRVIERPALPSGSGMTHSGMMDLRHPPGA